MRRPKRAVTDREFGQLVRGHRERLGFTMTELAQKVSIDQGLLSKIERALRPPPQIVPFVQRLASCFQLNPSSKEYRQLMDAAYRERFGESPRKGALLVTYGPAIGRGLGGLPPELTAPDSPAGQYYKSLGHKVGEGLKDSGDDAVAERRWGSIERPRFPVAARPPDRPGVPRGSVLGQLLSAAARYGVQVTRYEQKEKRFKLEIVWPGGEEYVVSVESKNRKGNKRGKGG